MNPEMTVSDGAPAALAASGSRGRADRPIRLLVFTSLYPNAAQPRHGIFVEERLRQLVASKRVAATVVAPVPWFPFKSPRFGSYAACARVPAREQRHGITILHPRHPVIPKVGMNVAPALMYRAVLPTVRQLLRDAPAFDVIDAHYLYPDGVAAMRLGQALGLPVVMTARGTDVNVLPGFRSPRRQILGAARRASAIITVSAALRDKALAVGVEPDKVAALRNGVDLDHFAPRDRDAVRVSRGLSGSAWLAVGNLVESKGVHLVIDALMQAPGVTLLVAGDGPEAGRLRERAQAQGVAARVRFLGSVAHDDLPDWYNAADVLMLASSREGMPNVVLESLACGTPVVAAPFDGVGELMAAPAAGEVAESRSADGMLAAWRRLQARSPSRASTRQFAERFGWQPVVEAQCALYERVVANRRDAGDRVNETADPCGSNAGHASDQHHP